PDIEVETRSLPGSRAPRALARRAGPVGAVERRWRSGPAYPGRIGIVGGGWKYRLPKPTAVSWAGGASPITLVVPRVTSTSRLSPKPTPTTPPVAPWPADTDAAATGSGPGEFRGPGGDPLPAADPFAPDGFDGPGVWEPEDGESEAAERPLPDGVVDAEAA